MSRFTIIGENIHATRVLRLNGKRVDLNDDGIESVIYHKDGKKYDKFGNVKPQEKDALTCDKAISATIFKKMRDKVTKDETYQTMRKQWRELEKKYDRSI